jgi:hypothetical protein
VESKVKGHNVQIEVLESTSFTCTEAAASRFQQEIDAVSEAVKEGLAGVQGGVDRNGERMDNLEGRLEVAEAAADGMKQSLAGATSQADATGEGLLQEKLLLQGELASREMEHEEELEILEGKLAAQESIFQVCIHSFCGCPACSSAYPALTLLPGA